MSNTFTNRGRNKKSKKSLSPQHTGRKMKPYEYGYIDDEDNEQYVNKHKIRNNWKQQINNDIYDK